ncbi:MAG: hypothetical protein PVH61_42165 [Candidatus Aminicenantes bacterium]|jgi:hypothetical protein
MNIIYIIIMIGTLFLVVLVVVGYLLFIKTNQRITNIEKSIQHLSAISQYFPDFIEKGEQVTKNISEELTLKQDVLNKLISEADKVSERLSIMEEKVRVNKMDKETVNKILILVNQGFTPTEIAPKLNIPLGEIELVVKLRRYLSSPIKEKL